MLDIGRTRGVGAGAEMGTPGMDNKAHTTVSGVPVNALYTSADLNGFEEAGSLGRPGHYPFTRGIHESMYRQRLWTMRQFAGFGRPADTNRRFRFLLTQGQTG